jgi:S-DNA-T family DNA segregation ATPase FtsK/SpoIIIE
VGLWVVTQSVYSLVFALLGPLVAAGGLIDGRRGRRRTARQNLERTGAALERVEQRIRAAQQRERQRLMRLVALPSAPQWDAATGDPIPVRVGTGVVASAVEVTGDDDPEHPPHDRIQRAAADPRDGPVIVDAADGIGVVGPPVAARGLARAIAVQLCARLSPAVVQLAAPDGEDWVRAGPHAAEMEHGGAYRWVHDDGSSVLVAWAQSRDALPVGCALILDAGAGRGADLTPHPITMAEAREAAQTLSQRAEALGVRPSAALLPERVNLSDLLPPAAGRGLWAPIGRGASGLVGVDLVADGPHALVAGTTGSGKSELLVSWVLAMAHGRSPADVSFLLIDFKGGAAFAPLSGLPHVCATLSDLDAPLTRRAVESLKAEVLRRELLLARAAARAFDELPAGSLARLVIVVDEFAALVTAAPELHEVFGDLAARGRSLGLHLILCTQRPSGVVRDAVLANVGLRIALRVTDRSESTAVVGVDDAARLPVEPRGRAILALDGATSAIQLALAGLDDARRIASATPEGLAARPWCDPLPPHIALEGLEPGEAGLAFGRLDLTAEQRQPTASYDPLRDGHLLVIGGARSGVTTALSTLAEAARRSGTPVRTISHNPADAWAQLCEPGATGSVASVPSLLVIDDLDALLSRFPDDHRAAIVDRLGLLLRGGPGDGPSLVVGTRRLTGGLATLGGLFGSRLSLRQATRDEHLLAGGDAATFEPGLPPGRGRWQGAVVQVARAEGAQLPAPEVPAPTRVTPASHPVLAVVAARPQTHLGALHATGARVIQVGRDHPTGAAELVVTSSAVPTILIGDPDAWQADWNLLTAARREWPIVLIGCTTADHRALLRDRELPPLLGNGECWLAAEGRTVRAVLDLGRDEHETTRGSEGPVTRESEEKHPPNR